MKISLILIFISSFLSYLRTNNMLYVIKYKLFFHTFNKEIEETIKVDNAFCPTLIEKATVAFIT